MIDTHRLGPGALAELAAGNGDRSAIGDLRAAQHSKHLLMLHLLATEVAGTDAGSSALDQFLAGYDLLAKVQAERPGEIDRLFTLPQVGAWAHGCLTRLDRGLAPDYGYLASLAAAAATSAGVGFELGVELLDERVRFPGRGHLTVRPAVGSGVAGAVAPDEEPKSPAWLSSDGECLTVGHSVPLRCDALLPADPEEAEDGPAEPTHRWSGTPLIRATAGTHRWEVLLESADGHLNQLFRSPVAVLTAGEVGRWRERIEDAWRVLARQGRWPLDAFADVVSVIVPLAGDCADDDDFVSSTHPGAFGAIATSLPPDPVVMAETLIHEFQHLTLSALLDMVPLVAPGGGRAMGYAAWRPDPRPVGGLLQGLYAHLAVARFWDAQRRLEADPDDQLRAQVLYERWRRTIEPTADALLGMSDCLTPDGVQFVATLKDQGRLLESESVPFGVREIAEEIALDHWLTWQVRHLELDSAAIEKTAAAFLDGDSAERESLPAGRVEADARQVTPAALGRMLSMRHFEPRRFGELRAAGELVLSQADGLLIDRKAGQASEAYREEILASADPRPQSWVGLAIAASRVAPPLRTAFSTRLPLMFEVHRYLASQGVPSDPMDLADWLA